jgi:hypothetical protein
VGHSPERYDVNDYAASVKVYAVNPDKIATAAQQERKKE